MSKPGMTSASTDISCYHQTTSGLYLGGGGGGGGEHWPPLIDILPPLEH